jgi:hypothetical protein
LLKYCIYQYIYSFNVESVHFKQTHENKWIFPSTLSTPC